MMSCTTTAPLGRISWPIAVWLSFVIGAGPARAEGPSPAGNKPLVCTLGAAAFDATAWPAEHAKAVSEVLSRSAGNLALLAKESEEARKDIATSEGQVAVARQKAASLLATASPEDLRDAALRLSVAEDNEERSKQLASVLKDAFNRSCGLHASLLADLPRCSDEKGNCMALSWKTRLPDFSKAAPAQDKAVAGLSEAARTSQERVSKVRGKLSSLVLTGDQTAARAQGLGPAALGLSGNPARAAFEAGFEARRAIAEAQRASNALVSLSQAFTGQRGPEEVAAAWKSWRVGFLADAQLRLALAMTEEAYGVIESASIDVQAAGIGDTPGERASVAAFLRAASKYPDAGLLLAEEGVKFTASNKDSKATLKLNLDALGKTINQQTSITLSTPIAAGATSGQLYSTVDGKVGVPTVRLTSSVVSSLGQDRWVKWQLSIFGLTGSWGTKELEHYDAADLSKAVKTRISPWSVGGFWTLAPATGGWVSTLRVERQHAWTAAPDTIQCTPPTSTVFSCVSGAGAPPKEKLSTVSRLNVRRSFGSFDAALQVRYDTADKSTQVELPFYFIRTEDSPKKPFSAGVTLGWNKKDKAWVGVFVGAPFSLLDR